MCTKSTELSCHEEHATLGCQRLIGFPIVSMIIPFHSLPLFSVHFTIMSIFVDSNILIHKTCACPEIWSCVCPKEIKYGVMLADFDFITESKEAIDPSALPNVRCQVKSDE